MRDQEVRTTPDQILPLRDRALVEVMSRGTDEEELASGLLVVHGTGNQQWQPDLDWEIGTVIELGESDDWEPVEVGDQVMVRAPSGGRAGSDIGNVVTGYQKNGQLIIVEREEIVCKMVD